MWTGNRKGFLVGNPSVCIFLAIAETSSQEVMRHSKSYPVRLCARLKLFDYRLPPGAMHQFIVWLLRK